MARRKEAKQERPLLQGEAGYRGDTVPVVRVDAQSGPSLSNPKDCSPSGSSVRGILGKNTGVGYNFLLQAVA